VSKHGGRPSLAGRQNTILKGEASRRGAELERLKGVETVRDFRTVDNCGAEGTATSTRTGPM